MKILVISHTYCAAINRVKWVKLAELYPECSIKVVFPDVWPDILFTHDSKTIENSGFSNCSFLPLKSFRAGNEVLYRYSFKSFVKIMRSFRPDLIHVEQGDNALSYFQSIILSKIFCPKAHLAFFTWINWKEKRSLKYRLLWSWIEKFNLKFSHGAFVGNHDAKEILKDKSFSKPIKILPQLGVDLEFFKPSEKKNKEIVISFIGRFVTEKGIYLLADAFSKLVKDFSNIRLLYVGGGAEESSLRGYIKKMALSDKVDFVISATHEKIRDVLQSADMLVLPSYDTNEWKEQFGHVLIEAMATKVVVIGSDAGEIPNVIANAGLVFTQKSTEDLYKALQLLLKDTFLKKSLIDLAYKRVQKMFSHEAIARETYSFWREIKGI